MRTDRACRSARRGLPLFLSGDLSRGSDALLRQHLIACPACRRELRAWLDLDHAFRAATGPEAVPPAVAGDRRVTSLDEPFFEDLRRRVLAAVAAPRARQPGRRTWVGGVVAAAALFAIGFGLVVFLDRGDPRALPPSPGRAGSGPPPSAVDSGVPLRPVGLRSRPWTGLQGRASADELVDRTLLVPTLPDRAGPGRADHGRRQIGGFGPATQPLPLREPGTRARAR